MQIPFSLAIRVSCWKCAPQLVGLVFLAGCVTAKLPSGPDVYAARVYPDKPKIAVAKFKDTRASEKAGSVGFTSISVNKQDLENLVTGYALECLNRQLDVNVERVNTETPEEFKGLAGSLGVKGFMVGKITGLEISSADAVMDPADVLLTGEVWLYDLTGRPRFHEVVTGKYSEWIGFKLADKATGRLVDAAARTLAHQLGSRLHEEGVLKVLE
jgi:hypothetical protein